MTDKIHNPFEQLINYLLSFPLWIKQVIYTELKANLELSYARLTIEAMKKTDTLQVFTPVITFLGKRELETKQRNLSDNAYKFLMAVKSEQRVIDICIDHSWTLEECIQHFLKCMEFELVSPPVSPLVYDTALYIAGKIRLGEYLIKLNKISIDQLDQALRTQKYIEHSIGERTGLAEVMINLGYITKHDTEGILLLKEESKKPFSMTADSVIPASSDYQALRSENFALAEKLDRTLLENKQLREQLQKILNIRK